MLPDELFTDAGAEIGDPYSADVVVKVAAPTQDEIAKYPGITYLGQEYTDNEPSVAAQKVSAKLSSDPDLAAVFATNLNTGEGAATGLRNAGKTEQVRLVGFDDRTEC